MTPADLTLIRALIRDVRAIDAAQHLAYHARAKLRDDGFWVCVTLGNYANKDEEV